MVVLRSHSTSVQVLELGGYDAILGYDWLKLHSPMTCYWDNHKVEFMNMGQMIQLSGVQSPPMTLSAISANSLVKLSKGNDVWAMALVNFVEQFSSPLVLALDSLLQEFEDVFTKPNTLPPSRVYDHTIPLLPQAVPVNSKPYRYSPGHKDEIECQVKELLDAGLISHSSSPFASPVLLV